MKMFVYGGDCRMCETGLPIGEKDIASEPLYTGDIVIVYIESEAGVEYVAGLSVVVCNQWQTYSDGKHVLNGGQPEFFVMGIKGVSLCESGKWRVKKVKSHSDAINGEHWENFGFNFKEE